MTASILDIYSDDNSDEDFTYPPPMQFIFTIGDNVFADLTPEENKPWDILAAACETGTLQRKDWNSFNGDCSFDVRGGKLIVNVTRSGNGYGGSLDLILDAAPAASGFRQAAELTRVFLAKGL